MSSIGGPATELHLFKRSQTYQAKAERVPRSGSRPAAGCRRWPAKVPNRMIGGTFIDVAARRLAEESAARRGVKSASRDKNESLAGYCCCPRPPRLPCCCVARILFWYAAYFSGPTFDLRYSSYSLIRAGSFGLP
jgi:hypothetical protein